MEIKLTWVKFTSEETNEEVLLLVDEWNVICWSSTPLHQEGTRFVPSEQPYKSTEVAAPVFK